MTSDQMCSFCSFHGLILIYVGIASHSIAGNSLLRPWFQRPNGCPPSPPPFQSPELTPHLATVPLYLTWGSLNGLGILGGLLELSHPLPPGCGLHGAAHVLGVRKHFSSLIWLPEGDMESKAQATGMSPDQKTQSSVLVTRQECGHGQSISLPKPQFPHL